MLWILWVYLGVVGVVFLGYQAFFWYTKWNGTTPILLSDVVGAITAGLVLGFGWPLFLVVGLYNLITKGSLL